MTPIGAARQSSLLAVRVAPSINYTSHKRNSTFLGLLIINIIYLMTLTGCNTMDKIGIPEVYIDDSCLGNNLIGERLKKDSVWAGGARYQNGADASDKNDNVYPIIYQKIQEAQAKSSNIEEALNTSNLGVKCQNNMCQYQGSYKRTVTNVPNRMSQGKVISTKTIIDNVDIFINFNPNKLKEIYKINVQTSKKEVAN